MTNADKIRSNAVKLSRNLYEHNPNANKIRYLANRISSMSDDKLVKVIPQILSCDACAFEFANDDCNSNPCAVGIKKWLEQEAEE